MSATASSYPDERLRLPSEAEAQAAAEGARQLAAIIGRGESACLRVIDGHEDISVPMFALRMLRDILTEMADGNAVSIVPLHAQLTTQQAADFLQVSRPFLIRLLERGEIPSLKVGRHRRVRFEEVRAYQQRREVRSHAALDALAAQAQELDMGY